nr:hypothetical protein [uncultured Cohaesibacter sp.]
MGFTEVYLIGMDFSYVIPKEHKREGDLITSTTDDPNHFHKDYFGKGKTWKDPKLERVALNYRQAKLAYEAVGRKVYNATIGGELEIFQRVDYNSLFTQENACKRKGVGPATKSVVATGELARKFSSHVDFMEYYVRLAQDRWAYTHSDANQKLWIAHITPETPTKGIKFVGIMELTSSCDMTVDVTLGRSGNSPYEGASKVIKLAAGEKQKIELSKTFEQEHTRLKLQLNVKDCDGNQGEITFSSYGIIEAMESLKRRHDMEQLRIKDANKLYRDEKYATSLGLFVALFKKYGLQMYMDNALRAANKIGLSHCRTNQDVLDLFK